MRKHLWVVLLLGMSSCTGLFRSTPELPRYAKLDDETRHVYKRVDALLEDCTKSACGIVLDRSSRLDTAIVDTRRRTVEIHFNRAFAQIPFREDNTAAIQAAIEEALGRPFRRYEVSLFALGQPLEALIPNYYRTDPAAWDAARMPKNKPDLLPLVRNTSKPFQPNSGLWGRHIALWHSHGWYYEPRLNRWEWQRARTFQTVEDLLPMAFTLPYLIPMLERAGANVFVPRERDVQRNEAIVDNDAPDATAFVATSGWRQGQGSGFAVGTPPYGDYEQPFTMGTFLETNTSTTPTDSVIWQPHITETGEYAVYVAYQHSTAHAADAKYTVYHAGGKTVFEVDQRKGGGTWIYLGHFRFAQGQAGRVVLTNESSTPGQVVSADAVRFGGGVGNISRNGQTSGRPRYLEAARYYLQYAGFPDSLVYNVTEDPNADYVDDYRSRGEWVNYLRGAPFGPNKDRDVPGLGIPIDLSLAFHTDAGISRNDTTVGTLMIYSSNSYTGTVFPDSMSRFANRDLGDLMQTQIVEDIRSLHDPAWTRRSIWDRDYSEAYRPNVPSALLELLAHQNYLDMRFALDPQFRFDVSRAVYKSILRFLATQHQVPYVVQPLPVSHFQAEWTGEGVLQLRWQPVEDPLEPTARATGYVVYTREEEGGFDNGRYVAQPQITLSGLAQEALYSFYVTAVNEGGESMPSEILSASQLGAAAPEVLIVNGFDRVGPPATLEADSLLGFWDRTDQGVPDRRDISYTGTQFNFDANSPWLDDDAPGHGASFGNQETTVIAGNTFDFPYLHGQAIRAAGYSFASASDEAVMAGHVSLADYSVVDLLLGEEKTQPKQRPHFGSQFEAIPAAMQKSLYDYLQQGGRLFVSGAYLGTDLFEGKPDADRAVAFGRSVLKINWRTNWAAYAGEVASFEADFLPLGAPFAFQTALNPHQYAVEAPDGIEPADSSATTLLRYAENHISAAVGYRGPTYSVVNFGFPFEAITTESDRVRVMQAVLRYLLAPVLEDAQR